MVKDLLSKLGIAAFRRTQSSVQNLGSSPITFLMAAEAAVLLTVGLQTVLSRKSRVCGCMYEADLKWIVYGGRTSRMKTLCASGGVEDGRAMAAVERRCVDTVIAVSFV